MAVQHLTSPVSNTTALTTSMSTQGGSIVPPTLSEMIFHSRTFTWMWVSNLWILLGENSTWNWTSETPQYLKMLSTNNLSWISPAFSVQRWNLSFGSLNITLSSAVPPTGTTPSLGEMIIPGIGWVSITWKTTSSITPFDCCKVIHIIFLMKYFLP